MTQEELGQFLGVKKSAVQKYENGSIQNLKLDTIKKLCTLFEIYPWELIYAGEIDAKEKLLQDEVQGLRMISVIYGANAVEMLEAFVHLNLENQIKVIEYTNALLTVEENEKRVFK